MLDIASAALDQGPDGPPVVLARAVRLEGFGSRRPDQAALFNPSGPFAGRLLGGVADGRVTESAAGRLECELIEITIGDDPAVRAGLACGGSASIAVQDVRLVPAAWWRALLDREPAALVTTLSTGRSQVLTRTSTDGDPAILQRLGSGRVGPQIDGDRLVEIWWPRPRMLVLGAADLAGALERQAGLLGWDAVLDPASGQDGPDLGSLGPADALVVLTHDHDVATPALAAALGGRVGFVGALGSRHTQEVRRERLAAAGLAPAAIDRLHGPVGLDLGARSPEEQALAICAEIVAVRSGRGAGALKDSRGPING